MEIEFSNDSESLSKKASDIVYEELIRKPEMLLCIASGSSPLITYKILGEKYKENPSHFRKLRILKLDEWGGIAMNNPQSCEAYIQKNIIQPLHVSADRYIAFNSNPERPEEECSRIASFLKSSGPIDICLLGLGLNGHIAFNEPGDFLLSGCHIVVLSQQSLQHSMASGMVDKPTFGLTIGMADILQSKRIIMLLTGSGKKEIINAFLSGRITTKLPASFLWLHHNIVCLVDNYAVQQ